MNRNQRSELLAIAELDRLRSLLKESLLLISEDTITDWLVELHEMLHRTDSTTEDRLEANAMLVGVLTCMLGQMEDAREIKR